MVAIVQFASTANSGNNSTAFGSATTAGNRVIAATSLDSGTSQPASITLTGSSDTFTMDASAANVNGTADVNLSVWSDANCSGGHTTVLSSGTSSSTLLAIYEVSGTVTAPGALTSHGAAAPASTLQASFDSGAASSIGAGALWIGAVTGVGSGGRAQASVSGSWTTETAMQPGSATQMITGYQAPGGAGAPDFSGTFTAPGAGAYWAAVAVAYQPAGIFVLQSKLVADTWTGLTFTNPVTAGSTVVLVPTRYGNPTMSVIAPTIGGVAAAGASQAAVQQGGSGSDVYTTTWILPNVAGGTAAYGLTVVDANSDTVPAVGTYMLEIGGLGTSPQLAAAVAEDSGTGTTLTSGPTGTFTGPAILIGSMVGYGITMGELGAPWTEVQYTDNFGTQGYQVVDPATATAYTFGPDTASASAGWAATLVAIKPGSGPATQNGAAALSATATLAAAATLARHGAAAFSAPASFTAAARDTELPSAHLSAPATFTATGQTSHQGTQQGQAALAAYPFLIAAPSTTTSAQVQLNDLWVTYQAAAAVAASKWAQWRMMRQAGGTDGSAGFLFGQAYEAENAKEGAYAAYLAYQRQVFPGARG